MEKLIKNGVSPNIASFLGATNVRKLTVGYENRDATDFELKDMEQIVETGNERRCAWYRVISNLCSC